jgi:hypothetical protein
LSQRIQHFGSRRQARLRRAPRTGRTRWTLGDFQPAAAGWVGMTPGLNFGAALEAAYALYDSGQLTPETSGQHVCP